MWPKLHTEYEFLSRYLGGKKDARILNAGSSELRYSDNCVNVDIQNKENVDLVCDIHALPESMSGFDAVICNAVLQYCANPRTVAREFLRVLKPGGYLFVDAPWMQPYCQDTPDKFRFSDDGLRNVFATDFEIVESGPSISSGSALAYLAFQVAGHLTSNKYVNFVLGEMVRVLLYPIRWVKTNHESRTAGAFYLICRKPASE